MHAAPSQEGSWGGQAGRAMHRHRSRMMLSRERVQVTFLCSPCAVFLLPRALLAARGAGATAFCSQTVSPGLEGENPWGCRGDALLPAWGSRSSSPWSQQVPFPFSFPHQKPSEGPWHTGQTGPFAFSSQLDAGARAGAVGRAPPAPPLRPGKDTGGEGRTAP